MTSNSTIKGNLPTEIYNIAYLIGWAYVAAYSYEIGYLSYFGIPGSLAEISLGTYMDFFFLIVGILIFFTIINKCLATAYNYFCKIFHINSKVEKREFAYLCLLVLCLIPLLPALDFIRLVPPLIFFICILTTGVVLVFQLLSKDEESDFSFLPIPQGFLILGLVFFWTVLYSFTTGISTATKQFIFPTTVIDNEELALIAIYNERAIGIQIPNGEQKRLENYRIIDLSRTDKPYLKITSKFLEFCDSNACPKVIKEF